jgi:hypothetical protein
MRTRLARTLAALTAIVFFTPIWGSAQIPTKEDTIHCNEKVKEELETANASPRLDTSDPKRPEPSPEVKRPTAEVQKETAKDQRVADPQLQGIDPEGAKDPAYVAAYKKCMRQSGF